jgi:ferredoxin
MTDPAAPSKGVLLRYGEHTIWVTTGERLLDAILGAGFDHRHICGGHGFCTSCRVEVVGERRGLSPVGPLEKERLGPQAGKLRLACQTRIMGPCEVRTPQPIYGPFSPFDEGQK